MRAAIVFFILLIGCRVAAQTDEPKGPFVTLKTGEIVYYDDISLEKGKVVCIRDGVTTEYDRAQCKNALIASKKKDKTVLHRQVLFASSKLSNNLGGAADFAEGDDAYNIVVKNGDDMIVYKNSPLAGGGVAGNQTVYYHIKAGKVSKIEFTEWRDDAYMQELVNDFGVCPVVKKELQDFKASGKAARQTKYDFFMQALEKKYLASCPN